MPRNPKCFHRNSTIFVTTSVQEGLPLVATPYMTLLIEGILAAAQTLYPITICHHCFMQNHIHLILVVQDPANVHKFMGYLKGELSHAINRLLGRNQRSVWVSGYDSPVVLDPEKIEEKILYLYLNSPEAHQVEHVSQFPGVNSYQALLNGGMTKTCRRVSRDAITPLPERTLSLREQQEFAETLRESSGLDVELKIDPWAWLGCFEKGDRLDWEKLSANFLKKLAAAEERLKRNRKHPVVGAHALRLADPRRSFTSVKTGKRMICLSSDPDLRKRFIEWFKERRTLARTMYRGWRDGHNRLAPPPGFFLPGGALLSSIFAPFFIGILY